MNEKIKELAEQCGFKSNPDIYDRNQSFDISKFAELILNDVMSICEDLGDKGMDGHYCVDAIRKKYFGVDQEVTEPNGLHTCPYAEEIHNDYETLCDCDEEQTYQCAMDI
jgi:hypothetical protein